MVLDLSDITVMIVEDQRSVRGLLITTLRTLGVGKVIGVHNAAEAINRIRQLADEAKASGSGGVNAVMLDIVLSDSEASGMDLAEWVRTAPDSPNKFMPIMMFSALASVNMVQRSRDLGVNVFMRKPFAVDNLTSLLMGLIRDQRNFIKCNDYFGPDRRRASYLGNSHDPERRNDEASNSSKGLKVFKRTKGAGSYVLKEENVIKAEEVFNETTGKAVADLDQRIEKVRKMHLILAEATQALHEIADEDSEAHALRNKEIMTTSHGVLDNMVLVRLNLGVFRVPILSQIAHQLSEFVCRLTEHPLKYINNDAVTIIDKFIHFMTVVMKHIDATDDRQGQSVVKELQQACERFIRKYVKNPMDQLLVDQKIRESIVRIREQKLFDDME